MKDDSISRQAAIDAIFSEPLYESCMKKRYADAAVPAIYEKIKSLPSAQPERLTDDDFETIRIHLSAYKERLCNQHRWKEAEEYQRIIDRFMSFASAQQKKCSDILEELKDDEYYNYIHTGHTRFSEDDWDYLIHNAKEKEELHERLNFKASSV